MWCISSSTEPFSGDSGFVHLILKKWLLTLYYFEYAKSFLPPLTSRQTSFVSEWPDLIQINSVLKITSNLASLPSPIIPLHFPSGLQIEESWSPGAILNPELREFKVCRPFYYCIHSFWNIRNWSIRNSTQNFRKNKKSVLNNFWTIRNGLYSVLSSFELFGSTGSWHHSQTFQNYQFPPKTGSCWQLQPR